MTTPQPTTSETPTPRMHETPEVNAVIEFHKNNIKDCPEPDTLYTTVVSGRDLKILVGYAERSTQLEKELKATKEENAVMHSQLSHEIVKVAHGTNVLDAEKLSSELDQLKRANWEMRNVLEGQECHCLNESSKNTEFACPRCKAISSTPATQPSPSIPRDVAEKMYGALQFLITETHTEHKAESSYTLCPVCIALTLAQQHGLGKKQ